MDAVSRIFIDMMGREVTINLPPKRIISLVPSQTELLYDLGLNDEVVGITKFCVHPTQWFRNKKRIGGTKTVHIELIKELKPDLIIANKEENTKEQIEELQALFPVWISDIQTIDGGLQMIRDVGAICGKEEKAQHIAAQIEAGFQGFAHLYGSSKKVAYFIWRNPWMCAGGDTFIGDIITTIGWQNVLSTRLRYPQIELNDLKDSGVELILLSSEPYPFKDIHIAEIKSFLPGVQVMLVDGEMFSWYGSRMRAAIPYLAQLLAGIS